MRSHQKNRPIALLCFAVVLLGALWFVFVWTTNLHEHIVGAFCAIATLTFTIAVVRTIGLRLTIRFRDLLQVWRLPWYIVSDSGVIAAVLIKDILRIEPAQNLFRVSGFDSSTHDPVRIGRTVMAVAFTTTAPNSIVLGIDPAQSRMLFHQIQSSSLPIITKKLGARP